MKYTVNLYKADNKGFLVARACMKSALQLGGNNIRDTRLLSPEMPQWNNSPWYAPVPTTEYAYTNLRAYAIRQVLPDLKNPEVMNRITGNKLDLRVMRSILSTDENTCGGLFLQYIMSFPRWVNSRNEIEVGGADYFDMLEDAADAECKAIDSGSPTYHADTKHIATISARTRKRNEALANVAPDKLHEVFAQQERQKRCGIDDVSALFLDFVYVVGRRTGCNAAAETAINAIRNLIALLGSCGISDILTLETACNSAEDALSAFCRALATKQDAAESSKPVHAVIVGKQAEQLASNSLLPQQAAQLKEMVENLLVDTAAAVINTSETRANVEWLKDEEERKKGKRKKIGRANQRKCVKGDNWHKTDAKLRNQIMTEVRQTTEKNKCSQSNACEIVSKKHLKADGKTPIFSKRTIENWMSAANTKKKARKA